MADSSNMMPQERQNKMNLTAARSADKFKEAAKDPRFKKSEQQKLQNAAKTLGKGALTGMLGFSLFKQIDWLTDWMIFFPLFFAVAKDVLNYVGFNLPGINEVFSFSIGVFLFLVLAVLGSNQKKSFRKYIANLVGMALEEIYGLNFLPIETITVIVCFTFVLVERLQAAQERKENPQEEE